MALLIVVVTSKAIEWMEIRYVGCTGGGVGDMYVVQAACECLSAQELKALPFR